jgi:hypothetical protein
MDVVAHMLPLLVVLENVRCLECGDIYAKPATGDTVRQNPGCPTCGYIGWIPISLPPERESPPHFVAGRRRLHPVPRR